MRIALFSGNYNYLREGANQALNRLVDYVERTRGHRVRIYSPTTDTPAFEPAGTLVSVPSIALPVRSEFRLALGLPRDIRADLESFAPELVHLSTPDILGTRAQSFARALGIPVVASLHTRFETYLEHYRLGWARPLAEAHLRRFYRRCDHVFAPTESLVDDLRAVRGDDRVSRWSRGVDRTLFNAGRRDLQWRRLQGWSDNDVVVMFFGRLVVEKGVDSFVSVMRRFADRPNVRTLVVGAGPAAGMFESLPGAVLTGHLEGPQLARAIASADILLHPSETETFGNVILEAMACGVATVCAAAQNATEILTDGRTGWLCPPRDVKGFALAVDALAKNSALRRALGGAALEESAAYSWDSASRSVANVYERIGGRAPAAGRAAIISDVAPSSAPSTT